MILNEYASKLNGLVAPAAIFHFHGIFALENLVTLITFNKKRKQSQFHIYSW